MPSSSMPIAVRYSPGVGVVILVVGVLTLLGGLAMGKLMLMALGGMNAFAGLGFATQPMFVVHADRVELKSILGMTLKTVQAPLAALEVSGNKLTRGGASVAGGLFVRGGDLARVGAAIEQARARPLPR